MRAADIAKVPAGGALAVDRDVFSAEVQKVVEGHPLVTIRREEIAGLPPADWSSVIVATGPLTSPALAEAVRDLPDEQRLAFRSEERRGGTEAVSQCKSEGTAVTKKKKK